MLPRIGDDLTVGAAFATTGFSGVVLKAHYESTVGRARAVAHATGLTVHGGVALNEHVGGINPSAVAAALRAGGRVAWMPTADAHTQQTAGLLRLCDQEPRLPGHTYAVPPVDPSATEATDAVLALVADADVVLATGHLSAAECKWLTTGPDATASTGSSTPTPPTPCRESARPACATWRRAAATSRSPATSCCTNPGCTPALLARVGEAAGDRLVLSSDSGQPDSPLPPEALTGNWTAPWPGAAPCSSTHSPQEGLDRGWLTAAASTTPESLFAYR